MRRFDLICNVDPEDGVSNDALVAALTRALAGETLWDEHDRPIGVLDDVIDATFVRED